MNESVKSKELLRIVNFLIL